MAAAWLFLWSCSAANGGIEASGTLEAVQIRVPSQASGLVLDVMVDEANRSPREMSWPYWMMKRPLSAGSGPLRSGHRRRNAGSPPGRCTTEDLDQAREALSAAEENLRLATDEADRLRRLFGSGSVSEQQLDRAESTETLARGARAQAASALAKLEGGARSEEIDAARASLDQAEAATGAGRTGIVGYLITAPSGGTILYRLVDPVNGRCPELPSSSSPISPTALDCVCLRA
jgi:multidrug efflux pump subunit AcrA (membrane-fusion protein)